MSSTDNFNYTMYEEYYKKAKAAYISGRYKEAKKLFYSASDSLLLAAKESSGATKEQLLSRTKKLAILSDSIKINEVIEGNGGGTGNTEGGDGEGSSKVVPPGESSQDLVELIEELNSLIGLDGVKREVRKRIAAIQVDKAAKEAGSTRNIGEGSLHMIFSGNPGTGKTTVARLLGKIYAALGVLKDGNKFVETDRSGLVGKYVGHTAQMVNEKVNEALGGILFIDEAYALYKEGSGSDFGEEAVAQLVKCMEDNRDNLVVILAGYTDQMENFINHANPGLKSRFRNWIQFDDYSVNDLVAMFKLMLEKKGMKLGAGCEEPLYKLISLRSRDEKFGNGRGVRNTLEDILDANNTRLSEMLEAGQSPSFELIQPEDIYAVLNG